MRRSEHGLTLVDIMISTAILVVMIVGGLGLAASFVGRR